MYRLASMLSTALTDISKFSQKLSLNISSFYFPTLNALSVNLTKGFIFWPTSHARLALLDPTSLRLNKNYLLRFDISILSSSVTITSPYNTFDKITLLDAPRPINANILINSQPKAPAPTMNARVSCIFYKVSLPNKAIKSSYWVPFYFRFTSVEGSASKNSLWSHWLTGVNLPVYFTTS